MRFNKVEEIEEFLDIVNRCEGRVWLESAEGDIFNLKSPLSRYVAIAELLDDHAEELELYCAEYNDEMKFANFFMNHEI